MPSITRFRNDPSSVLKQIVISPSDDDYVDQLIPSLREFSQGNKTAHVLQELQSFAAEKETEIERQCNSTHQGFVDSVNQLLRIREGTVHLTNEILQLNQEIQASTEKLVDQKKALVESRGVRQNIDEAKHALDDCLEVLRLANQVEDLLNQRKYYAALRALDELQSVHLQAVTQYKISEIIQRSVPATQKKIAETVMTDLNTWLFRVREMSQYLGELSFYHTNLRKDRLRERTEHNDYLANFKLNSAIELVADEHEEFDILHTEELEVDFSPLLEALHIHQTLNQMDKFRTEYASNRRTQKDLLVNNNPLTLTDDELADLHTLLEDIAGFAILERATTKKVPDLRTTAEVEELWDSLNHTAISQITKALPQVDNAEHLLKIKELVVVYIQTLSGHGYNTILMSQLLLTLFDKYTDLLNQRFSEDFLEIVSTDDYMPMPIQNSEEYEKVVNVSWYTPDQPVSAIRFPTAFPFSQMYPLCCINIRNFLNQFYFFADDSFPNPSIIDTKLLASLDDLLTSKVCSSLIARLSSQYLGQVVQILINLDHFEIACHELEGLLMQARRSNSTPLPITTSTATSSRPISSLGHGAVHLGATSAFMAQKKTAENRIFELVNSKVSDLVETSDYDWLTHNPPIEVSEYITALTQYLGNIMSSVLLNLPNELKNLMLFNAISHTASSVLALPLSESVSRITTSAVAQLRIDVNELVKYVETLPTAPILLESLDELRQTVALMETDSPEEFYDISLRNKKYRGVDPLKGPVLLEKVVKDTPAPVGFQSRKSGGQDAGSRTSGGAGAMGQASMGRAAGMAAGLRERWMHNR
ncbi:Rab GTPase-binding exocyst subunit S15 [Lithohypha guttulata]|nr:Rab GTPase-binding exocyst subunit S15 [Lithohypha guttulata]